VNEGLDVYTKYQPGVDFGRVAAAGRRFVYVKATDGLSVRDTGGYGAAGRRAGLAMGAYGYAQFGDPRAQYGLLVREAKANGLMDLGPALDLESPFVPGKTATDFAIGWLRMAVELGNLPVFYANDSMMGYLLPAVRAAVPSVWPWIARYGAAPKNSYRTWQYSSTGSVPGVGGSVDMNKGEVPVNAGKPLPTPTPTPGTKTSEVELMERKTIPKSPDTVAVRLWLPGTANAAIIIRPRIDASGEAPNPVWLGNIFAWGSDKVGVGHNPKTDPNYAVKITSHHRHELPGAVWADLEYSCNDAWEIDIVG
jgi:lysozyme